MKAPLKASVLGLALGFSLSRIGFSSWDEVNAMFTFASFRLLFTFACGVITLGLVWKWLEKSRGAKAPARPVHPGTVVGGVLFGVGWALCGACPSIALVQLGEGQLGALWTLVGMFAGNFLYSVIHERYFRWSPGSCEG